MATTLTKNGSRTTFSWMPELTADLMGEDVVVSVPSKSTGNVASNLVESWGSYWLQLSLPGVDLQTLDIQVVARHVTVQGKYRVPLIEAATYLRHEVATGEFSEVFTVPGEVDADQAEARYDRGILTVRMPKVAYLKSKSIKIQTGE